MESEGLLFIVMVSMLAPQVWGPGLETLSKSNKFVYFLKYLLRIAI